MLHTIKYCYRTNISIQCIYLPCDKTNHENLCEYNMMLTDIAKCCAENDVSYCIIGSDLNTDLSGNTISLQKFISKKIYLLC